MSSPVISSNTLFHFTRSRENLINILTNNFCASWGKPENFPVLFPDHPETLVKKVCFCDIPLSQTGNHIINYGEYAIGLTKKWGRKMGVTPVLYLHENSTLLQTIIAMNQSANYDAEKHLEVEEILDLLSRVERYMKINLYIKPYEGDSKHEGKIRRIKFYDEKEWRWIPQTVDFTEVCLFKNILQNLFEKAIGVLDSSSQLIFEPNDIRYIIVKKEGEILPMMEEVWHLKERYSTSERKLLQTRIISAEQIREDF